MTLPREISRSFIRFKACSLNLICILHLRGEEVGAKVREEREGIEIGLALK